MAEYRKRFDNLPRSRRLFLLMAVLLFLLLGWKRSFFTDHQLAIQGMKAQQIALKTKLEEEKLQEARILNRPNVDLDKENRKELKKLQKKVFRLRAKLGEDAGTLISPEQMLEALKTLVASDGNVTPVSLVAKKVKPINRESLNVVQGTATTKDFKAVLYRHDIELVVEAGYLNVLKLFQKIEGLEWVFYWEEVRFDAVDYLATRASIRLFTFSLGKGLIGGNSGG
ncbi:MAG: hypothetical protein HQL52_04840 [Magnetococcales bacterium]|nr:hypothetical protein [Magnetococcales bacterium]